MNTQLLLDKIKLLLAQEVITQFDLKNIREKSLANLQRWENSGAWCSAYGEWREIMTHGTDVQLLEAMTGTNEMANRLRQSPPYSGLLSEETVMKIRSLHVLKNEG